MDYCANGSLIVQLHHSRYLWWADDNRPSNSKRELQYEQRQRGEGLIRGVVGY